MNHCSAVVVFTQSSSIRDLKKFLGSIDCHESILCLSTHSLFDGERKELIEDVVADLIFYSFVDFLTDSEMERCDIDADRNIIRDFGFRDEKKSNNYYDEIKRLKNALVKTNLQKRFNYDKCYLLNDDLGIQSGIWLDYKSENCVKKKLLSPMEEGSKKLGIITRIKKSFNLAIHYIQNGNESYLLVGSYSRVKQYLHKQTVISDVPFPVKILFFIIRKLYDDRIKRLIGLHLHYQMMKFMFNVFKLFYDDKKHIPVACTIHEYNNLYVLLSKHLGVPMFCIQDGYLPDNYSSKYLNYREKNIDTYLVWDLLSKGIFNKHGLKSQTSKLFSSTKLSIIPEEPTKIKNVLVITSGAGDWTALKNRSDEDRMFELFIEVAKALPEIKIIYRPHPLWAHPAHQGVDSIQRIFDYTNSLNISNLTISSGAVIESNNFQSDHKISRHSKSIEEEIKTADLIFGDHSQAIINAARRGKIIATVNVTDRRSFFECYNRLGFPNFKSSKETINFIKSLGESPDLIIAYNQAVKNYNENYCIGFKSNFLLV